MGLAALMPKDTCPKQKPAQKAGSCTPLEIA